MNTEDEKKAYGMPHPGYQSNWMNVQSYDCGFFFYSRTLRGKAKKVKRCMYIIYLFLQAHTPCDHFCRDFKNKCRYIFLRCAHSASILYTFILSITELAKHLNLAQ